eukprot:248672_1
MANYKIDDKVFSILTKKEFIGAITDFDEKEMQMVEDDNDMPIFQFGSFVEYWDKKSNHFVTPKFTTLKEELLNNRIRALDFLEYEALCKKPKRFSESLTDHFKFRNAFAQDRGLWCERTGIKAGTPLNEKHLLSIILFTDTSGFMSDVRKTLIKCNENKIMIETQTEIANFLRLLKETIVLYGDLLHKNESVYCGLDRQMLFNKLQMHCFLPVATTRIQSIAVGFAGDAAGIVLCMKNVYDIPVPYFPVGNLSEHNEDECIFFGASLTIYDIQFYNTVGSAQSISSHLNYIRVIRLFQSIINGRIILDENNNDILDKDVKHMMKEFLMTKIHKISTSSVKHQYLHQLFNHCYDYHFKEQKNIWINMKEIKDHFDDDILRKQFSKILNNHNNIATTFTWTIPSEKLSEFKHGRQKQLTSEMNVLQTGQLRTQFYMSMRVDNSENESKNYDDNDFIFEICMDNNTWNDDIVAIKLSIDFYCKKMDLHTICNRIKLTKDSPSLNLTAFLKKYNANICSINNIPDNFNDKSNLTWKISVRYEFIEDGKEQEQKDQVFSNDIYDILNQCIAELNYQFLIDNKEKLITECKENHLNISSFLQTPEDEFAKLLKHTLKVENEEETKEIVSDEKDFYNKSLSKFTTDQFLSVLKNKVLDDSSTNKVILAYFSENKITGNKFCAMSKKEFIKKVRAHSDNKKVTIGKLRDVYSAIKNLDEQMMSDLHKDKETQQLLLLYNAVKSKIKQNQDTDVSPLTREESILNDSVYMQSGNWVSKAWKKYHKQSIQHYQDTMASLLLQNSRMHSQFSKQTELKIKTVLAYYDLNKNIIPEFDVLIKETEMKINDMQLKQTYNGVRAEIIAEKEHRAMRMKLILKQFSVSTSNSGSVMTPSRVEEHKSNLINDNHVIYDNGQFMRYESLEPMYESLAEECIMNTAYNITASTFNKLLSKANRIHNKINLIARISSKKYGISQYEPIRIQHIMAIIMYIDETQYSQALSKSYLLNNVDKELIIQFHANNFYFFGRYLFEAIEFFGEKFDENSNYKLYQGSMKTFKFNAFGYSINFARSTTPSMDVALHFGAGSVFELIPKYKGSLNDTKNLNLAQMCDEYQEERLFWGRGCFVNISNVVLSQNKSNLEMLILPLTYLEKILKQTIFDSQFYNAKHLYRKSNKIQTTLLKLMAASQDIRDKKLSKSEQIEIIGKYFTAGFQKETQHEILYSIELLHHWCSKQAFVTFEALPSEIPYMIDELKLFFVQDKQRYCQTNDYVINVDNVCSLMPNLKYYRDCYQEVVYLETGVVDVIDVMNINLGKYYKYVNDNSYYSDSQSIGKFKLFCSDNGLDAESVEQELTEERELSILCDFDDNFPIKNGIISHGMNENTKYVYEILKASTKRNMNIEDIKFFSNYKQYETNTIFDKEEYDNHNIIDIINDNLGLYYQSMGDNSYYKDDFEEDCKGDKDEESFIPQLDKTSGKFVTFCEENKYDEKLVVQQLETNDPENSILCTFDDNFPLKIHIHGKKQRLNHIFTILQKCRSKADITKYLNEYQSVFRVLPNLALHEVADHIVDALEAIQFNFMNHQYKEKMLETIFENKLQKLDLRIGSYELLQPFIDQLETIGIANASIATGIYYDILDEKETETNSNIIDKIMNALKEQSDEFKYLAIDINEYKKVFATMFKDKLDKFYYPISKLHGARKQDFVDVAKQIELFDNDTVDKLSEFLFNKLFYDIEIIKPWMCDHCSFTNRKMMVGSSWRLYNQLNECGLCGKSRYNKTDANSQQTDISIDKKEELNSIEPLLRKHIEDLQIHWSKAVIINCNFKTDIKMKQIYLDNVDTNDVISLIENCINDLDENNKDYIALNSSKNNIIDWCRHHEINGAKLVELKRTGFAKSISKYITNKKIKPHLLRLYGLLMKLDIFQGALNCGSLKRVCIILEHFQKLTDNLSNTNNRYPYEIKKFLYSLQPNYSPMKLLEDIDHILHKHPNTIQSQPYIECSKSIGCPHLLKATRTNDKHKNFKDKQEFFHCDNWKDYVYISTLAKIHTALLHANTFNYVDS